MPSSPTGFGNNSVDYTNPFGKDDSLVNNLKVCLWGEWYFYLTAGSCVVSKWSVLSLAVKLIVPWPTPFQARGFSAHVVQVDRKDWFRVARSLLTLRFWSSSLDTAPGYTW